MSVRGIHLGRVSLFLGAVILAVFAVLALGDDARATHAPGEAAIFIAGDVTGIIDIFAHDGVELDDWDGDFTLADALAVGDLDGDGEDEVLVAGDVTGNIDIFDQAGIRLGSFNGGFTLADGFAVGDVNGDGSDEILVAGDVTGNIDIFNQAGSLLNTFDGDYTLFDGFAVGDVDGDGSDEILVAGDFTGTIDIFTQAGLKLTSFDGDYTLADGFAVGNVTGGIAEEILVAGDVTGTIDVFDFSGTKLNSFDGGFTLADGFAAGDVNGDGLEEILVAGDVTGVVDVFNFSGTKLNSFDGGFTSGDGFAVGGNAYPDADLDGLLDSWETNGLDVDNDGTIDVNLPGMGADPLHKDLFLELDVEAGAAPTRADVQAVKAAFAAAPLSNPDGTNGVNLWVDTGGLVDPGASEGAPLGTCLDGLDNGGDGFTDGNDPDCQNQPGARRYLETATEDPPPADCGDGIDNDGDGLADGADPDCLVGDNLGGGGTIPATGACKLDSAFYTAKAANFNSNRALAFRYAISANLGSGCAGTGGQGEIGGNDFIDFNHDGGTLMHELGHNLNLRHGGTNDNNCKPNYVSVMNYDLQFGIQRVGGGAIIDYSPPRIAFNGTSRGTAPLASLKENDLDEPTILDAADSANRFVFVNSAGQKVQNTLNVAPDWNNDGDPPSEQNLTVNINTSGTNGRPAACTNGDTGSTLNGATDWPRVSIRFRQFGDSDDGAINPELEPVPTLQQLEDLFDELNTTDLSVAIADSPDPAVAGLQVEYTMTVTNHGPNPAVSVQVTQTLPAGLSFFGGSPGCSAVGPTVNCVIGEMPPRGAPQVLTVTADIAPNLVYDAGAPLVVSSTAVVENVGWPDADVANNSANEDTRVVAVADLDIVDTAVNAPLEILIGEPSPITLTKTITNHGPSAPMDIVVTVTATASPGASVSPTIDNRVAVAVGLEESRKVQEFFTLSCEAPGDHTFTFENEISPHRHDDTDPDWSNNEESVEITVECVVPVAINIRPKGFPNSINLNTDATLAVLTTTAGEYGLPLYFDATTIDPLSVLYGLEPNLFNVASPSGATEQHAKGHLVRSYELDEKTRDDDLDMVLHFKPDGGGLTEATTEACVKGKFAAGSEIFTFFGCDSVEVRP